MVIIYATFPGCVEIDDMHNVTLKGPQELEQQLIESVQKARASPELVQSMLKVSRKAAELEWDKLQIEIQKEQSE